MTYDTIFDTKAEQYQHRSLYEASFITKSKPFSSRRHMRKWGGGGKNMKNCQCSTHLRNWVQGCFIFIVQLSLHISILQPTRIAYLHVVHVKFPLCICKVHIVYDQAHTAWIQFRTVLKRVPLNMAERLKDLRTLQTLHLVRTLEAKRGPLICQVKLSTTIKAWLYIW